MLHNTNIGIAGIDVICGADIIFLMILANNILNLCRVLVFLYISESFKATTKPPSSSAFPVGKLALMACIKVVIECCYTAFAGRIS
jgi:hypothetical protein